MTKLTFHISANNGMGEFQIHIFTTNVLSDVDETDLLVWELSKVQSISSVCYKQDLRVSCLISAVNYGRLIR